MRLAGRGAALPGQPIQSRGGETRRLPAYLDVGGAFKRIEAASTAEIRRQAKLHREIARRHNKLAERLDRFADTR